MLAWRGDRLDAYLAAYLVGSRAFTVLLDYFFGPLLDCLRGACAYLLGNWIAWLSARLLDRSLVR